MNNDKVHVSVETNGRPVKTYQYEGKTFIESREDTVYQIRVKNKTNQRVKVCIGIDGVSIISGKTITDTPDETGYILGAYAEEVFKGYRVDDNQVSAFKFGKKEVSYATETGQGQGNGVIAVRTYAEKIKAPDYAEIYRKLYEAERNRPKEKEYIYPSYPYPYWYSSPWTYTGSPIITCGGGSVTSATTTQGSFTSVGSTSMMQNTVLQNASLNVKGTIGVQAYNACVDTAVGMSSINSVSVYDSAPSPFAHGTQWGQAVAEKVTMVEFETGLLLDETVIYYAPEAGLLSLGVNMTKEKQVVFPEPFKRQYCEPPRGWNSGVR